MATLGETLYAARSAREETLEDVARVLRIRPSILLALESGEISALPSGAVTKGFVRTYTKYLGLDDNQAVRLFEEESGTKAGNTQLVFPEIVEPARLPGWRTVIAGIVIFVFAVASWFTYSNRDALGIERVGELPDRLVRLIKGEPAPLDVAAVPSPRAGSETDTLAAVPPVTAVPESGDMPAPAEGTPPSVQTDPNATQSLPVTTLSPSAAVQKTPEPTGPVIIAVLPPLNTPKSEALPPPSSDQTTPVEGSSAPPLPSEPDTSPDTPQVQTAVIVPQVEVTSTPGRQPSALFAAEGTIYGDTLGVPRVVVRALGDSWVQVRNETGRTVFSRILRTGDIYRVPNDLNLTMIAGSIGDLQFWVDGAALPPLGDKGRVRRDIPLDAARLTRQEPGR